MVLKIIVAAAQNNGIGRKGDLPWSLKKEMAYFAKLTKTVRLSEDLQQSTVEDPNGVVMSLNGVKKRVLNVCLMGRHSWESIPLKYRLLKDRYNIVLSSNPNILAGETSSLVAHATSISDALNHIDKLNGDSSSEVYIQDVFVIGGHRVFKEANALTQPCRGLYH